MSYLLFDLRPRFAGITQLKVCPIGQGKGYAQAAKSLTHRWLYHNSGVLVPDSNLGDSALSGGIDS